MHTAASSTKAMQRAGLLLLAIGLAGCARGGGDSSSARVGPEGGALVLGELRVTVPPGALERVVELTARRRAPPAGAFAPWFEVGPDGLRFARPVEISIHAPDLPAGRHRAVFTVAASRLVPLLPPRLDGERLAGVTAHLSPFGLAELDWPYAESQGDEAAHHGVTVAAPGAGGIWLVALPGQLTVATRAPVEGLVHVAGLPPGESWVLYRVPSHEAVAVPIDVGGYASFTGAGGSRFVLQPAPSTRAIFDDCSCRGGATIDGACAGATSGAAWDEATRTCTLLADLDEAVQLFDGVTLDCNGRAITGTGSGAGVTWWGAARATLRRCRVDGFTIGVQLLRLDDWPDGLPGWPPPAPGRPGGEIEGLVANGAQALSLFGAAGLVVRRSELFTTTSTNAAVALVYDSREVTLDEVIMTAAPPTGGAYTLFAVDSPATLATRTVFEGSGYGPVFWAERQPPPAGLELSGSTVAGLAYGGVVLMGDWSSLPAADRPRIFHNNVCSNGDAGDYQLGALGPLELSHAGSGNYWGRGYRPDGTFTGAPLFVPGVDTNRTDLVDSHPHCRANAWQSGELPCTCDGVALDSCVEAAAAPTAALTVTPGSGDTDTRFTLDASASAPAPGAGPLEYRFDLEGDLIFDTPFGASAVWTGYFPRPGSHRPLVEVRDARTWALARAQVAAPIDVSTLPPAELAATPPLIRLRSRFQDPWRVQLAGQGLSLATAVTLAGEVLVPRGLDHDDAGVATLALDIAGDRFPWPEAPASATLVATNVVATPGGAQPASASLSLPIDRDRPAIIGTEPPVLPRYNRSMSVVVRGGYFYPESVVTLGGHGPLAAVADTGGERLTVTVPQLLVDTLLATATPPNPGTLTLSVMNRAADGASLAASVELPWVHPYAYWIAEATDQDLGITGSFDADYDGADPVRLALTGQFAPETMDLLVVNTLHRDRFAVVPMPVSSGTSGTARVPRYGAGGAPLFDAPVELRVARRTENAWSGARLLRPVYPPPRLDAHSPNALQARPVAPALGKQYLTLHGDNFYRDVPVWAVRAHARPGVVLPVRLPVVEQSRHHLVLEVAQELTEAFPDPQEPYGPVERRSGGGLGLFFDPSGELRPGVDFDSATLPHRWILVLYLGETELRPRYDSQGNLDPTRRRPERDSRMIAWDEYHDWLARQGQGALPPALAAAEHDYVGGTVLTYYTPSETPALHAQLSFWSRAKVYCLAIVRDPGAIPSRDIARFRLSTAATKLHLDPGDDVRRYTTPDFGALLTPGDLYEYSILCAGSASASSDEDTLAHTTLFRAPDPPTARPVRQRPVSFAVVSDVAWCSRWREEHWGKCPADSGGETAKHKLQTWRVANVLSRYFYHGAIDFLAAAGDLSEADNQAWTYFERFLPYFEPVMAGAPLFAIQGNHDIDKPDTSSDEYFAVFNLPMHDPAYDEAYDQWTLERVRYHTYESKYYALHYGTVGLAAFDHPWVRRWSLRANFGWLYPTYRVVNYYDKDGNLVSVSPLPEAFGRPTPQWRWLEDTLPALRENASWIAGMTHEFNDTVLNRHAGDGKSFSDLVGLGGIDLLASGHWTSRAWNHTGNLGANGSAYMPAWRQKASCKCKDGPCPCQMEAGFRHYTVTPGRVVVRRVDIGTGQTPGPLYEPRGLVTGCWVVERQAIDRNHYDPSRVVACTGGDTVPGVERAVLCDSTFDPVVDCHPDLMPGELLEDFDRVEDYELPGYGLENRPRGYDDRDRFAAIAPYTSPSRGFLVDCMPGYTRQFPGEGKEDKDPDDDSTDDPGDPVEASCTECQCRGDSCTRVKKYQVRRTNEAGEVEVMIPQLDPLCEVVP